jgi:hypothetical protein
MKRISDFWILIFHLFVVSAFGSNVQMSDTVVKDLPEMTVMGSNEVRRGDMLKLYLTEDSKKMASNALDAISSLPRFSQTFNSNNLSTISGEAVTILIDGVPSQGAILRSYKPEDVSHIDYYDIPPAKYRIYGDKPLINVVMKRRYEYLIGGDIFTSNALTRLMGNHQAGIHFTDSLNMVRVNYNGGYDYIDFIDRCQRFEYAKDDITEKDGKNGEQKRLNNNVNAIYQRFQGKNLFNVTLGYGWNHRRTNNPSKTLVASPQTTAPESGEGSDYTRRLSESFSADLYYRRDFSNAESLTINVTGAYSRSKSEDDLRNTMPTTWDYLDYDMQTRLRNKTLGITGYAGYTRYLFGGSFSTSVKYSYNKIRQNNLLTSLESESDVHDALAYVGMNWRGRYGWFSPQIGIDINSMNTIAGRSTSVAPDFSINAGLLGKGLFRNFVFRAFSSIFQIPASLGETTGSVKYIDRYFISKSNPDIRQYYNWANNVFIEYSSPDGRHFIRANGQLFYEHRPFITLIHREGDMVVSQMTKIPHRLTVECSLNGTVTALSWMQLRFSVFYSSSNYDTPYGNRHNHDKWSASGAITVFKGPWLAQFAASTPSKSYDGDFVTHNGQAFSLYAQWRWRNLTVGANWTYNADSKTWCGVDGFSYRENYHLSKKNTVVLTIGYSFAKGRARRHAQKDVNNLRIDDGLRPM